MDLILSITDTLWQDGDRFNQRAAAELLQGTMRGLLPFRLIFFQLEILFNI